MSNQYVIVGGSRGVGYEISEGLLNEGHRVHVISRNKPSMLEASFPTTFSHDELDVTTDDFKHLSVLQSVDGLVYCPGSITLKPIRSLSSDQYQNDFNINVLGAVKAIQTYLPVLKKSKNHPSIVMFSTVAVQQGMPFHSSIAASKGAVEGLTRSLAAELAPKIRVNSIAPSLIDTDLASSILS